jgi:hypothetical protein
MTTYNQKILTYNDYFNKQVIIDCSTQLNNLSLADVERYVINILNEHQNTKFNQYSLYNKLLGFAEDDITFINLLKLTNNDKFKKKYLNVLNTIQQKHENITVIKNKNIISLILNPKQITKEYTDHNNKQYNDEKWNYEKCIDDHEEFIDSDEEFIDNTQFNNIDFNIYKHIIDNHEDVYFHLDKKGNSIYHAMVNSNFEDYVIELIENDKFDIDIKNNIGLTPIDVCENPKIFKLLTLKKIKELENKISKYESTENSWILITMFNNIKKYFF